MKPVEYHNYLILFYAWLMALYILSYFYEIALY